jgi:protein-ribulosamine 3-kinase
LSLPGLQFSGAPRSIEWIAPVVMALWNSVAQAIAAATGRAYEIRHLSPVMGGRVSDAYVISDGDTRYFVKAQNDAVVRGYEWEARSLRTMAAVGTPAPAVIATGRKGTRAFIVLEYIASAPSPSSAAIAEALLRLHANTAARFGADGPGWASREWLDNTPSDSWADFWCERRLAGRLSGRCAAPEWDGVRQSVETLLPVVRAGLTTHRPVPVLLHGDLNNQNWLAHPDGSVLFIDAEIWYGDPEVDLAALGGGSSPAGRAAVDVYLQRSPRGDGYAWRRAVYTLWYMLACRPVPDGAALESTLDRIARGPGS